MERLWAIFLDVPRWPDWNPCFWRAAVKGGELREGATLRFAFNPIERRSSTSCPRAPSSWRSCRTTA